MTNQIPLPFRLLSVLLFLPVILASGCGGEHYRDDRVSVHTISPYRDLNPQVAADLLGVREEAVMGELARESDIVRTIQNQRGDMIYSKTGNKSKRTLKVLEDPPVLLTLERPDPTDYSVSQELTGESGWHYVIDRKQGVGKSLDEIKKEFEAQGKVGHPFASLFSDEFGGVFYEKNQLIIRYRNQQGVTYVYINPYSGAELTRTPTSRHLVNAYFNGDRSVIYSAYVDKESEEKTAAIYRYSRPSGAVEQVLAVPLNRHMKIQDFVLQPRVSFKNERYLIVTVDNAGRGVGFGGLIVADLASKKIIYSESSSDDVYYNAFASNEGSIVFERSIQGSDKYELRKLDIKDE